MNYTELRKEAIHTAVNLSKAMLAKNDKMIELNSYKLNHTIAEMLEKLRNGDVEETNREVISGIKE